ncbi:MAG: Gfo/Idh/MocA family oxidoreductase [Victivallaceae bacterium]|nr:Gfo/Idh/MocA family oxidoreductase [Victivallaceae bacterium]
MNRNLTQNSHIKTKQLKINVAVLGLGKMGNTHVKAAKASPFIDKIIGYEPTAELALERGREMKIETVSNLDLILNDQSIKLFYIAAVNEAHAELAVSALNAGKAVMCEKPMGITMEEAKRIVEAQKTNDSFLQIGFELRYSKLYMKVKEWIDAGLIGKPLNSYCQYYTYASHKKDTWRAKSKGTLIGEKLSHYLDLPRWWFGREVTQTYSMSAPNFIHYFNHPDNHQISYKFADGAVSSLNFVMGIAITDFQEKLAEDGHLLTYFIYGDKGAIATDLFRKTIKRWSFSEDEKQLKSKVAEEITFDITNEWVHNVHDQNMRIAELVAKNQKPDHSALDAFETMKLCFAAEISTRENRVVKLNEI